MKETKTVNRRATPVRRLKFCMGVTALAMASGCSSADDGGLPSIGPGEELEGSASPHGHSPANQLLPANTPIFDDEASMNLVAQVGLQGRVIKFFEPEEGTLLQVEMAIPGAVTLDVNEKGLSGSALYAYLTKTEAPAALVDAERRVIDLAARNGIDISKEAGDVTDLPDGVTSETSVAEPPAGTMPGVRPQAEWDESPLGPVPGSESYFMTKYCTPTDRFWSCGGTPAWICADDSSFTRSGVNMMQAGAWAGEGTHDMYVKYGTSSRYVTIRPGYLYGWRRTSGTNRSPISEVYHGGTGWYRHCVNYHY